MNQIITKQNTLSQTFSDKCMTPLFWAVIAYSFGFFHGYSRRKRKPLPSA